MRPVTRIHFTSLSLDIASDLYIPEQRSPDRKGAAIIVAHPLNGSEDQTLHTYATTLCEAGFFILTFDAGYQGDSGGFPRMLEDPHQRIEDIKNAVTYLGILNPVNANRIGVLGIDAAGGYASFAAQSDIRIKAVAGVSATCMGAVTRNGGFHENSKSNLGAIHNALQLSAKWRDDVASSRIMETSAKRSLGRHSNSDRIDVLECLPTVRKMGEQERLEESRRTLAPCSFDMLLLYESFRFQHFISPRPVLMIAGSNAQTLHFSRGAVARAAVPKELFTIPGKDHYSLYNDLTEAGPKLIEFFSWYLTQ
ncbi:hypothetical protein HIM_00364 [Hirsutella minnesotensis 3608]|nr:hypothetical protein HIM_00364 [Hirsutella minnesotensis 3608]